MNATARLWTNIIAEGYAVPTFRPGSTWSWAERVTDRPIGELWCSPDLLWERRRKRDKAPDIATLGSSAEVCVRTEICSALLGATPSGLELLPFTIEGAPWTLVNCLRTVEAFDPHTAEFDFLEVPGHGRVGTEIRWINVTDPSARGRAMFGLRSPKFRQLLWTDELVERCRELGLKGLDFKHVGYVVPDAEHAVARPAPQPAAPAHRKYKGPKLIAEPMPPQERRELELAGNEMRQRLQLPRDASAEVVLARLNSHMAALRPDWIGLGKEQQVDALLGLSAIYGDLLCSSLGWSWIELRQGRRQRWIAVLAPTGGHALAPVPYFHLHIGSDAPTAALLFNMIASGSLPPAEPGQIVPIG